jgi:hypothetical protein
MFEIAEGTIRELVVVGFQFGRTTIQPTRQTELKEVYLLRLFVDKSRKPTYPYWWDITQITLIPQLLPFLEAAAGRPVGDPYSQLQKLGTEPPVTFKHPVSFRVSRIGTGPRGRFTVTVNPPPLG